MLRFVNETLRLDVSFDDLIISTFQNGVLVGPLYTELCKNPLTTAQSMWNVVRTYAKLTALLDERPNRTPKEAAMTNLRNQMGKVSSID